MLVGATLVHESSHNPFTRAPREEISSVRLEEGGGDAVEADVRIASGGVGTIELLEINAFGAEHVFRRASEAVVIAKHPEAKMFHGLIRKTKDNTFGYQIELLHSVDPDKGGNGIVFFGYLKTMPLLDGKK